MDDSTQLIREDLNKIDSKLLRLCTVVDEMNAGKKDDTQATLKSIEKRVRSMAQWIAFIGFVTLISVVLSICGAIYAFLNLQTLLVP